MEMGRGAVGAPLTPLSPDIGGGGIGGGGGVTLGAMGMKDLNKEVTRAMQDEFQNEKGKVDDEEAKITFNSLESDDQTENLLRLMKQQEIQKKRNEKEERERRKMEKLVKKIEEKDKNLFSSIQGRGKRAICVEDAEGACVCSSRREADKNAVGSDECTEEWSEAEQGGVEKRKGDEVEGMVAVQRGSGCDTQEGKEMSRERITSDVSEGERDKNIQLEQRAWKKRCAFILKIGIFLRFAEFNCGGFDEEYPSLNLVAPFDSADDFASNENISLQPPSNCTSSLVDSSFFMNIQLQSSSLRTFLSPSLQSQTELLSSAFPAIPEPLFSLSPPALSSSTSFSFNSYRIQC
ncbi:uncharacterized protein MONOS_6899 [Monocercomonoides exilis]|uniref:uncharacterized protein n=1 Tax=Monocercomonoides exilis TaxID=2049356 RepID=UPI00355949F8|nr:hypothetical protein MONOS_6899 [Monocercomonoides exilis]|eukprot:MONOS_6899.1-p1 / transcript=MONOS_6899.1 / gene=MONOS_6899 / organism=Monocercomonoides_exilis_PA203 / gene_product=unspecified product / transcript_product=unspecified product / location=Mono_scaffold00226:30136-31394(+) / protein_length=349 / sequence_SO=supercontig / SO=protein_coding / is_pseudo=false